MQHFTSVEDVTDLDALLQLAHDCKRQPAAYRGLGTGRRVGLLFMNPSLRTRLSAQLAALNLGMEPVVMQVDREGWKLELRDGAVMQGDTVEHIRDAAPILGAYFDILCVRSFPGLQDREADEAEQLLSSLKRYAAIPIVSLESATLHPLQSLADLMTIQEHLPQGRKPRVVLSWAPHIKPLPQCVANSFAQWMLAWGGCELVIARPEGYDLAERFTRGAAITNNQEEALQDADFVYVKNWSAYEPYGQMPPVSGSWMLQPGSLEHTHDARVMHCLPVRRNVELSDALLDGPSSLCTRQAANRVWATQAVFATLLQHQYGAR